MHFDKFSFGSVRIDGSIYEHDVVAEGIDEVVAPLAALVGEIAGVGEEHLAICGDDEL